MVTNRSDQIEGWVELRVGSCGPRDMIFSILSLPDPHAGQHTPDPTGTIGSDPTLKPSDIENEIFH